MSKRDDVVGRIPGGWYGNDPTPDNPAGSVAINPARRVEGVRWLGRRAEIVRTYTIREAGSDSIGIAYRIKGGRLQHFPIPAPIAHVSREVAEAFGLIGNPAVVVIPDQIEEG